MSKKIDINTEDEVSASAVRGFSGVNVPTISVYTPSYATVTARFSEATISGKGAISYGQFLAAASADQMKKMGLAYDTIELNNKINEVESKLNKKAAELKTTSDSGAGFTKAITEYHDQVSNEAADSLPTRLLPMFREASSKSKNLWTNSAIKEENEMTTAYAKRNVLSNSESILNMVLLNPEKYDLYSEQYKGVIGTLKNVVSAQEYAEIQQESLYNLNKAYALGLIKKDPYQGYELVRKPEFAKMLPHGTYQQILNISEHAINDERYRAKKDMDMTSAIMDMDSIKRSAEIEMGIEEGKVGVSDIVSSGLSPKQQKVLLKKLEKAKVETEIKLKAFKDMYDRAEKGELLYDIPKDQQEEYFAVNLKTAEKEAKMIYSTDAKAQYALKIGITAPLPELTGEIRSFFRKSSDASAIISAASAVERLSIYRPNILKGLSPEEKAFSHYISNSIASDGQNADSVIVEGRERFFLPDPNTRRQEEAARTNEYRKSDQTWEEVLNEADMLKGDERGFIWRKDAILRDELRIDTEKQLKEAYLVGFSGDEATKYAAKQLQKMYEITHINGEAQYMKNTPMKIYGKTEAYVRNMTAKKLQEVLSSDGEKKLNGARFIKPPTDTSFWRGGAPSDENMKLRGADTDFTKKGAFKVDMLIDGEWEKVDLYIGNDSYTNDPRKYNIYYFPYPGSNFKSFIYGKDGNPLTISYE